MELRPITPADIPAFARHRLEFVSAIREIAQPEDFLRRTGEYLRANVNGGSFFAWLAWEGEAIAASCMACLFSTAPTPSCPTGRQAELLNVYTCPAFRRQGLAEELVGRMLATLQEAGVEKVLLTATEMGLPLYEKMGFAPLEGQMALRL